MHKSEDDAVDELLQTYGETGGINYLDAAATLPSRPYGELLPSESPHLSWAERVPVG